MEAVMAAPAMRPHNKQREFRGTPRSESRNPWANDFILLNLSLWWVRSTRPEAEDFNSEVASMMTSLQRQLA
jgi:hypothetical protein